jgi:hypothetical protein
LLKAGVDPELAKGGRSKSFFASFFSKKEVLACSTWLGIKQPRSTAPKTNGGPRKHYFE